MKLSDKQRLALAGLVNQKLGKKQVSPAQVAEVKKLVDKYKSLEKQRDEIDGVIEELEKQFDEKFDYGGYNYTVTEILKKLRGRNTDDILNAIDLMSIDADDLDELVNKVVKFIK